LRGFVPPGATLAQMALRWILMFPEVTCAIPGAKRPVQLEENVKAAGLAPLSAETMAGIRALYEQQVRPQVHHRW
jgi:aryl-alcohol dehydrogenase-like predicted oxidoreductase